MCDVRYLSVIVALDGPRGEVPGALRFFRAWRLFTADPGSAMRFDVGRTWVLREFRYS